MKIKITHPILGNREFKVGFVYDVPVKTCQSWIEQDWAYPINEEPEEEEPKKKEVADGNRKNNLK